MELERSTTHRGDIIIQSDAIPMGNDNNITLTVNNLSIDISSIVTEIIKSKDFVIEHLKKDNDFLREMLASNIKRL